MIRYLILGSGSKGNATLIYDEDTLFQIDMGLPKKTLLGGLSAIGREPSTLCACLFTHDHSDHVGTVCYLPETTKLFAPKDTVMTRCFNEITPLSPLDFGAFHITPFSVSHDANNPVGYLIENRGERLVYVTDTGYLSEESLSLVKNADYYIFESNHDLSMLEKSHRPQSLKLRIHGDHGHLSNSESACYMAELLGEKTKEIVLAHLSEECNTPEVALSCYQRIFAKREILFDSQHIRCAKQYESVGGGSR